MAAKTGVQNSGSMEAITNVIVSSPAVGDRLTWNAASGGLPGYWANAQPAVSPGAGTATAVSGAATLNASSGVVTSESLSTATTYALTLTNSAIKATSVVLAQATENTSPAAVTLKSTVVTAGQVVLSFTMSSYSGTLGISFAVFN